LIAGSAPVLGFAAFSGTGKTTLLVKLLPVLRAHGLEVGLIKHAHHSFEVDVPGKDSFELRKAGANPVLVASRARWALMGENIGEEEPGLAQLLLRLDRTPLDLVLVEGFKHERFPKIELHRPALGHPLLYPDDSSIFAIATDQPLPEPPPIPALNLNVVDDIAAFILERVTGH
jgi:molybdopterin-guanine dinucleotide biosynthesis protein B